MGSSFEKVGECLYRNTSSGTYFALVKVKGRQIKASLETKNLPEARRKLKDFKEGAGKLDRGSSKFTLIELTKRFEKTILHLSPATVGQKQTILRWVRDKWPGGADRPVGKIKPSEVAEFLSATSGVAGFNRALEVLRPMFRMAEADGMATASPLTGITQRKREKPIRLTPTLDEFQLIIEAIRTQRFSDSGDEAADFVEFLGLAGLGQAEATGLHWSHVNFAKSQFITFRVKTRTGFAVPIYPQLRPLLEKRLELAKVANKGKAPDPGTRVFSIADAKKSVAGACSRLKLPNYTQRSFRRMFITQALEKGVDVKVIAQWQGHQDGGKLILDTYSHVRPVHSDRMAALMV